MTTWVDFSTKDVICTLDSDVHRIIILCVLLVVKEQVSCGIKYILFGVTILKMKQNHLGYLVVENRISGIWLFILWWFQAFVYMCWFASGLKHQIILFPVKIYEAQSYKDFFW